MLAVVRDVAQKSIDTGDAELAVHWNEAFGAPAFELMPRNPAACPASALPSAARWIDIAVGPAGAETSVELYAKRSRNGCFDCANASVRRALLERQLDVIQGSVRQRDHAEQLGAIMRDLKA